MSLCMFVKAGTHRPNHWTSEAFGETRTRSGTIMFGVFSSVGSFWSRADVVYSDWTCEVWGGRPLGSLIGYVLANQCGVWEGRNTVRPLVFYALRSLIPRFHVLQYQHETNCYLRLRQMNCVCLVMPRCMFSMQLFLSEIVKFRFDWK